MTAELGWWLGRNGIYCALAKPLPGVGAWEKALIEGQDGYFPNPLSVVNEDWSLKDPQCSESLASDRVLILD